MKLLRQLLCAFFLSTLFLTCAPGQEPKAATNSGAILLKAARLFDSTSGKMVEPGQLLIKNGKITSAAADTAAPPETQVIELGDCTLLPGFIDSHVHLSMEMSDNYYKDAFNEILRFPAEQSLYGAQYAKATLEAGFTTVRDVGSRDYVSLGLRNAIKAGILEGPRMLIANYAVGSTGGHADQSPYPPQLITPAGPIQGVANGPEQLREAVRYQIKYGADVIKFMPSGGV